MLHVLKNSAARYAYRIPVISETQALAYLVFLSNPNAGDQVTISEQTYTFVAAITGTSPAYSVLIGGSTSVTATNLLNAITADLDTNENAGTQYGTGTASNPDVLFYPTGDIVPTAGLAGASVGTANISATNYTYLQVGSTDFGAAFNTIPVAESTSQLRTIWLQDLNALADTTSTYAGGTNPSNNIGITQPSTWLEFLDQDTKVLKSQVVNDEFNRFYFASPSSIPAYNTYDRIVAGLPSWKLGVPASGCSPLVSVEGGGDTFQQGYLNGSGATINGPGNECFLIPFTPTGATTITDVEVFSSDTSGAGTNANLAAVVYADNSGVPGALLGTGTIITGISNSTANISTFVNPVGLIANTQYWLGFICDTQLNWSAAQTNSNNMAQFANVFANGPLAEAPTGAGITLNQGPIQMFGDFGTNDVVEARAYITTYVTAYNEEGPPGPSTLVDGWSNGVWSVTMFTPNTDEMGITRNITYQNLYRTVVGASGAAVFFYVATFRFSDWAYSLTGTNGPWYGGSNNLGSPSITINGYTVSGLASGNGVFTDTLPDNYVTLNIELPSTNWFPPPENLQGLIALPNGMMAGFKDNEVWFCVPYFPHAWDPGFVLTTDFPIVGLGVTSGALVAVTASTPYVINGVNPSSLTQAKCSLAAPGISQGSIISADAAVVYASPNGLIEVTNTGIATNTTDAWFTRENWQQLTPQEYVRAIILAGCYFAYGTTSPLGVTPVDNSVAQRGYTIELNQDNASFTIWPQPGGHRLGLSLLSSHVTVGGNGVNIDNCMTDPWTGVGLLISNETVYQYDFTDPAPAMVPYEWKSKIYQQNNKKNYEAMRAFFTVPINTPPHNALPNEAPADDPSWLVLENGQYGVIKTYADVDGTGNMVLVDCREITKSGGLLRLPSGFKVEQYQWEILGQVLISNIQIATSVKELANV